MNNKKKIEVVTKMSVIINFSNSSDRKNSTFEYLHQFCECGLQKTVKLLYF